MTAILDNYLNTVMTNVASELRLLNWNYTKLNFESIAQNYFGILIPINLTGKIGENSINFPIVLKLAPTDERYRVSGAVTVMFAREIFVYSKLLRRYQEIQTSLPISSRYINSECYYVCKDYCNEVICMENMCVKGYMPYVRSMGLDIDHISIAIKSLAKLHSLSYVIEQKDSTFFEEAKEICFPLTEKTNKRYIDILKDRLQKALIKFKNTSYIPLLKALEKNCAMVIESIGNSVKSLCLCHGDIWKENIMFQYKDNKPISACIIDYQTTRICSPAFDLLYLIISSTTTLLRKNHFNMLLDTYYQTFENAIIEFNLKPEEIYPRDSLDYDLKIVAPACLIVANTAIWLSSGLQQEGHVRSKVILNTDEEKVQAENKYKEIIEGIIADLKNYGYLSSFL